MRTVSLITGVACLVLAPVVAQAQLAPPNKAGVSVGRLHLTVVDVPATEKFFVTSRRPAGTVGGGVRHATHVAHDEV